MKNNININNYENIDDKYKKSKFYFFRGLWHLLINVFKYKRYVCICYSEKDKKINITYTGLTPDGTLNLLDQYINLEKKSRKNMLLINEILRKNDGREEE